MAIIEVAGLMYNHIIEHLPIALVGIIIPLVGIIIHTQAGEAMQAHTERIEDGNANGYPKRKRIMKQG